MDQLVGFSDNLENKELKGLVKTAEFDVGMCGLKGDASDAFTAPSVENIIQTATCTCASAGDASEAVEATKYALKND